MGIRRADYKDITIIKNITCQTMKQIYPKYYPKGVVQFFLSHHCQENIAADINSGYVYILEDNQLPIGTVTIKKNEINRLFVLPSFQGQGYGRDLLDFSETKIFSENNQVHLDSSLPSKKIYLTRGYREIETHCIQTNNGDYLCYDVLAKTK